MKKRIVIIGAVALGPKVACRIKRLEPDADVIVIDKSPLVSYGGCGIPYYVSGDVPELEELFSTSAHIKRDPGFFKNAKGVDMRTLTEAIAIDRFDKEVRIKDCLSQQVDTVSYDTLVLATGATPMVPPVKGCDLDGVSVVSDLSHARDIKNRIAKGLVSRAVVIGGGAIGLEMTEALTDLWGVETTLVEMQDQLLPGALGRDTARLVKQHMAEKKVMVMTSERVTEIMGDDEGRVTGIRTTRGDLPCELVIIAAGVRPSNHLAKDAGLALGRTGGIIVDKHMRTSDPAIYAGGDCVEIPHLISGQPAHMPLGSLANRQGRVIASNICGQCSTFKGAVGSFCVKVFDLGVARAGLSETQAAAAGFKTAKALAAQSDRAHFYPGSDIMIMKLIADVASGKVIGVEALGANGDAVKARVDAVAALLPYGPSVEDISNLEVAYAPPYASAMDIVNTTANVLDNVLAGHLRPVEVDQFVDLFKKGESKVLDVRSRDQARPLQAKYGNRWLNIPQEDLAGSLRELEKEGPYYLVCGAGSRAYEAQLMLRHAGIVNTRNVEGGMKAITSSDTEFARLSS